MDFQELMRVLPRPSTMWTHEDIYVWLHFINLHNLYPLFRQHRISGANLSLLDDHRLVEEIGIVSSIVRRKIILWIEALPYYDACLQVNGSDIDQSSQQSIFQRFYKGDSETQDEDQLNWEYNRSSQTSDSQPLQSLLSEYTQQISNSRQLAPRNNTQQQVVSRKSNIKDKENTNKKKQQKRTRLRISEIAGQSKLCYEFDGKGGVMGRDYHNQILILDSSVSINHCEIIYRGKDYFLKDLNSFGGTWIKIDSKVKLSQLQTCVIEMGSNKFLLETTPNKLQITMVEGKNLEQSFSYEVDSTKSVYIGRYHESEISIIDDNTLSFIHAKLSQIGSVWYFDDMNSTNGSWLRLDKSQLITHGLIFKLGNANVQYKCQLSNYILNNKNNIKCLICSKQDQNCFFLPCSHSVTCFPCGQSLKQCPICKTLPEEIIKIYLS